MAEKLKPEQPQITSTQQERIDVSRRRFLLLASLEVFSAGIELIGLEKYAHNHPESDKKAYDTLITKKDLSAGVILLDGLALAGSSPAITEKVFPLEGEKINNT